MANTPPNKRGLRDETLKANIALPLAANTACTASIDLGHNQPYPIDESFNVRITIDTATGANSKNINAVLQASNESNANFVNIANVPVPLLVAAGNSANVIGANVTVKLPPGFVKRYIRASATGEANGGDASDGQLTCELLF
jgi:hypothetical protein